MALTDCDVMISIGTRFNDRITGKLSTFAQNCKIIHIDVDAASISKNIKVDIPIVADAKLAIENYWNILNLMILVNGLCNYNNLRLSACYTSW